MADRKDAAPAPGAEAKRAPVVSKDTVSGKMKFSGLEKFNIYQKVELAGIVLTQIREELGSENADATPAKRRRVLEGLAEDPDSFSSKADKRGKAGEKPRHKPGGETGTVTKPKHLAEGREGTSVEELRAERDYYKDLAEKGTGGKTEGGGGKDDIWDKWVKEEGKLTDPKDVAKFEAYCKTVYEESQGKKSGDLTSKEHLLSHKYLVNEARKKREAALSRTGTEAVVSSDDLVQRLKDKPKETVAELKNMSPEDFAKFLLALIENVKKGGTGIGGAPEGSPTAAAAAAKAPEAGAAAGGAAAAKAPEAGAAAAAATATATAGETGTSRPEKKTKREQDLADAKQAVRDKMLAYVGAGLGWGNLGKDLTGVNADKVKFRDELKAATEKYKKLRYEDVIKQIKQDAASQTEASKDASGKTKAERLASELMYEFGEGAFLEMKSAEKEVHLDRLAKGSEVEQAGKGAKHVVDAYRNLRNRWTDWALKKVGWLHEDIGLYNKDASLAEKAKWWYKSADNFVARGAVSMAVGLIATLGTGGWSRVALVPVAGEGFDATAKNFTTKLRVMKEMKRNRKDEKFIKTDGKVDVKKLGMVLDKRADAQTTRYERHKKASRIMTTVSYLLPLIWSSGMFDKDGGGGGKAPEDHTAGAGKPDTGSGRPDVTGPGPRDVPLAEQAATDGGKPDVVTDATGAGSSSETDGLKVDSEDVKPADSAAGDKPGLVRGLWDKLWGSDEAAKPGGTDHLDGKGTLGGSDASGASAGGESGGGGEFNIDEIKQAIKDGNEEALAKLSPEEHREFIDKTCVEVDRDLDALKGGQAMSEADHRAYMDGAFKRIDENLNALKGCQSLNGADADHRAFMDEHFAKIDEHLRALRESHPGDADHRAFIDEHCAEIDDNLRALREDPMAGVMGQAGIGNAPEAGAGEGADVRLDRDFEAEAASVRGEAGVKIPDIKVDLPEEQDTSGGNEPSGAGEAPAGGADTEPPAAANGEVIINGVSTTDYTVVKGDNLWKILDRMMGEQKVLDTGERVWSIDELKDKFAPDKLTPEEVKAIGISSGNIDKLTPGDHINFSKVLGDTNKAIAEAVTAGDNISDQTSSNIVHNVAKTDAFDSAHPGTLHTASDYDAVIQDRVLPASQEGGGSAAQEGGDSSGAAVPETLEPDEAYFNQLPSDAKDALDENIGKVHDAVYGNAVHGLNTEQELDFVKGMKGTPVAEFLKRDFDPSNPTPESKLIGPLSNFARDAEEIGCKPTGDENPEAFMRRTLIEAHKQGKIDDFTGNIKPVNV